MVYAKKGGGMLIFLAIVSILAALFVFIAMPMIAKAYASGKIALKAAAARDIALLLDAMYAHPYDVKVEYDIDLSDFKVEISNKEVKIQALSVSVDPTTEKYPFVPINDDPNIVLNQPKKIIFEKKNGKLSAIGIA
ncbi:MAG: hypothetical protein AABX34_05495 [Nanoarchaeota archaeon]